ncbi:MFS transporter [Actinopolyspora saharensis]|uniref:Drug resistance transporter, EmrB/QacA subfamily n=1 Tax=Actinopolyspora saharensis TaxID=995062 RepID=A0A1H1EIP7_9ACTN|nr:MFS transporter [Actinopolyspora saharensis]SDQ88583.1 drug resistance transporter, EmrB/QacA subfamily [Actinopolyspora saharensis]
MSRDTRLVLPVVLCATFMQLLDVTIVQVAIESIRHDLRADTGTLQLVLAGYTLTYACLLITAGRLGDRYGYRLLFVTGMSVFTVASVSCAAAPTAALLIVARLVQGAGSGLMAPQVLSLIQTALPERRRSHALGLFGATMGIASLTGPLLGGLLLKADLFGLGWRTIFLINVPVCLFALVGSIRLPTARAVADRRIDPTGVVLTTTGLGLLVLPLTIGAGAGWPIWTWLCLGASSVILAALVRTQLRSREPLLHPSVFQDHTARTGTLLVFAFNAGVPSFTYVLFLHLQSTLGYPPLEAALVSIPYPAAAVVGSRVSTRIAARFGIRLLTASATLLSLVTAALSTGAGDHRWALLLLLAVGGAALGAFTASVFSVVLSEVQPAAIGSTSGLLPTAQQLGGTAGVTLGGLVFTTSAPSTAFEHAMIYETIIFLASSVISVRLGRISATSGSHRAGAEIATG